MTKEHLEGSLWVDITVLENDTKLKLSSANLPLDGNWIQTEFGTFHANEKTAEFVRKFKRQSKGAKFLPYFDKPNQPYEYVAVYYEGDAYPRGLIGYGDWASVTPGGRERYVVVSRRIANNKFTSDKPQHLMVATEKLDVAIQSANTYLTPHSAVEVGKRFKHKMFVEQWDAIDLTSTKLRDARIALLFGPGAHNRVSSNELETLTDKMISECLPALDAYVEGRAESDGSGESRSLHARMKKVAKRKKEYEEKANRCKVTWCVYVQVRDSGPLYKAARIPHIDLYGAWVIPDGLWRDENVIPTTWVAEQDVPAWLLGKLAVANTLDAGQYVPNIGYKINNSSFYIEELESDRQNGNNV
jgi:hypothetical protein